MQANPSHPQEQRIHIHLNAVDLESRLEIPEATQGIILLSYARDSQKESAHIDYLGDLLRQAGLATLLIDLLTPEEEANDLFTRYYRRNVGLLAERLVDATDWLARNPATQNLQIGYFGTTTGASAALMAVAERPRLVQAVVAQSGQPDLIGSAIYHIQAPTLLIAGECEPLVLDMNQYAIEQIPGQKQLAIIPGGNYCTEALADVAYVGELASKWFQTYLYYSTR
jgi:putative phosphoribosyl transferase